MNKIVVAESDNWSCLMDDIHIYDQQGNLICGADFHCQIDLEEELKPLKGKRIRIVIEEVE